MAQKDLTPFNKMDKEKHRQISIKGGKSKSIKKSISAKIRWMNQNGYKDKDKQWLMERINDPESDLIYLQTLIDRLLKANPEANLKDVISNGIALHRAKFGDKHKNININVELDKEAIKKRCEEIDEHIFEVLGKKE